MALLAGFFLPLLALAATAYVLGRTVLVRLDLVPGVERTAVCTALGLALLSHLLLFLGLFGYLARMPVALLGGAIHAVGFPVWKETWDNLRRGRFRPSPRFVLAGVILLAPVTLLALYPPTAFDATLYHLPYARAFVATGGVPLLPDLRFPVFPQAQEVLFAGVLLFGRDIAAHGVELLATLLTGLLLAAWGRRVFGGYAGVLAAACYGGAPIVPYLAGSAYIEPGLVLYVTASLYSADRGALGREPGEGGSLPWLALAAAFGATAADVKYLGLFFLGVAGLAAVVPRSSRIRNVAVFAGVALAVVAPWYLRIYLETGNPLFPFLPGLFGTSGWTAIHGPEVTESLSGRGVRWFRIPWDLIFDRARYNQQPPFTPVLLMALPLLVFGAWRDVRIRLLLVLCGVYGWVFTWLPPDSRYLVPVLPLACLAAAGSAVILAARWKTLESPRWAVALALVCLLPGWLYSGYRIVRQGSLPWMAPAREAYLSRAVPLYPAVSWLNRTRGGHYTAWGLRTERLVYYAQGRLLGDWIGPASFETVTKGLRGAGDLAVRLRRLGVDYLLVPRDPGPLPHPFPPDAELREPFLPVYEDSAARIYRLRVP